MVGIGIVIRDHEGGVMASSAQRLVATYSTQVAEAKDMRCGPMVFVSRVGNQVAHYLVKLAVSSGEDLFCLEESHQRMLRFLKADIPTSL
ncbi:hypothetical protein QYF36_016800 [Acer negundo]|nr:hypothetical protein QYF36_016800 [Acer negundo]